MSRFTGPRLKVMRALGVDLPGLSRKSIEQRPTPPGQHGAKAVRRKKSDFGIKLMEKQKLRFNYGLSERQLRRLMVDARRGKAPTGETLLQLLERRLDNVVFRAGFAPTIAAARQLVSHRHLQLNGKVVSIPSIRLRVGDEISLKPASAQIPIVNETLKDMPLIRPEWLSWDDTQRVARIAHLPAAEDVPFPVDVQQVVEYYANRL
ncbi:MULTISPECIES: 30S ribosomal protein S4 [Methylovorus]|jgi:small subunit ribosomal protein S4|uniref:30S ribosomal protein S4 n=1 Tax=Methylovorus TaxID=81682 RepID=UPI0001EC47EB|nr:MULTISPECIES: 30S ribosomal protein S4 [Methylovorus]ADQ84924.1 ribosomal protein S4 [Methylovorus sp. MP688]KAF0843676.1 SSU ribosomal protein S4P [Methylovorus glucosotrophus]